MILAAGLGTRLRPITWTLPKPLVPVCNRPLIGWCIEEMLRAGVTDLVVNLHYLPEPIERFVADTYGGRATIHFSYEPEILGTGGGIRKVRSILEPAGEFFVVNGDTLQFPQYGDLLRARRDRDALAAIALRYPPPDDRFTPVYFENGQVTGFGTGRGEALMFSGAQAVSAKVFEYLPDKEFSGMVDEVYMPALGREVIAGAVDRGPTWFDIGTPLRYMQASTHLRGESSVIAETADVSGQVERSVIGGESVVEPGAEVRDSVIWDRCRIGASVVLDGCIVTSGVEIARPLRARNAVICPADAAIPRDAGYHVEGDLVIAPIDPAQRVEM